MGYRESLSARSDVPLHFDSLIVLSVTFLSFDAIKNVMAVGVIRSLPVSDGGGVRHCSNIPIFKSLFSIRVLI